MNRYFLAENSNRTICECRFESIMVHAGTMIGVMAASDKLADDLVEYAKDPRSAVTEITEDEYVDWRKKKSAQFRELDAIATASANSSASAAQGNGGGCCPRR